MPRWDAPDDRFRQDDTNEQEWCASGRHFIGPRDEPSELCYVLGSNRYCRPCAAERQRRKRKQ